MKQPMPPPDMDEILKHLQRTDSEKLIRLLTRTYADQVPADRYLPWDQLRYKRQPDGLTHEEWWLAIKLARNSMQRRLPLTDKQGRPFTYALPDGVLSAIEEISRDASGHIAINEQVTNPATRDRYLVSSLIEEAITSSQLEGASTTRRVAKDMIRSGRRPRNRDERMILNNYAAMRRIGDLRHEKLTPELVCEIHRTVTEGTLENQNASGRFQLPGEERVGVYDRDDKILHIPPPAEELEERVQLLCDFANGDTRSAYIPPVLRAVTVHFMLSYDHPFEDGNGRTARALFYWSMLNQGYWLTEFLTISRILKAAPSKYAKSFLYTEQDDNDLTYFHAYHLQVIQRAIKDLHGYLARKTQEVIEFQRSLSMYPGQFNHRQVAILEHAVKSPDTYYTALSHSTSHNVTAETARLDLIALEERGLLRRIRLGRAHAWIPMEHLSEELRSLS